MYNFVNTEVICPSCGEGHMIREEPKIIKSNTETYAYLCPECGFVKVAKSDEAMQEYVKNQDAPICYLEAPQKCLDEKCGHGKVFGNKLLCLLHKKWFDIKADSLVDHTAKHDEGKPQIHLVPPQIIWDIAEVRMYGNAKYGDPNNWKTVEKWRYVDALLRHLLLYLEDPDGVDRESGIKHYKHAACNMAFICDKEAKENVLNEKG